MSTTTFAEFNAIATPATLKAPEHETVSVIIPCYNEERFIGKALQNLLGQYEAANYEIIVVDGLSQDRTRDIVENFKRSHPEIHLTLIDNPARNIPSALNLGIAVARGEIIARMDAHAVPSPSYIRRCVEVLKKNRNGVVGMPCQVQPGSDTPMARAIAMAVSHPFGIGDAKYRLSPAGEDPQEVDTVAFACFRKSLWQEVGGFDENLLTNEDYDFNYRVRQRGERVLLDQSAHTIYFARSTLRNLAAQYVRYGNWKARMIRQRPRSIKFRHLVAPLFVASIIILLASGFWRNEFWSALAVEMVFYFSAGALFAFQAFRKNRTSILVMLAMPVVFLTIHLSWGASFLVGLIRPR